MGVVNVFPGMILTLFLLDPARPFPHPGIPLLDPCLAVVRFSHPIAGAG